MRYIEAASPHDMEAFISGIIPDLLRVKAQVFIDLYVDEPMGDETSLTSFRAMVDMAQTKGGLARRSLFSARRDLLMGVEVDLLQSDQAEHFSRLAHQVINAEAWDRDRQIFGTVESPVLVWVDVPAEVLERALETAREAGALVHARPMQ
ncbi:hypothetical protein [Streptomyces sp. ITFR-16]|uniref:hypothetical protein n=1 Tax=Streptomyces sp. ITFR-16 TaxID=3075198 RepID=UPI00288C5F83|nr:hypothetical protein [Streptomyces sp. ITFR-16]WNI23161.1 hypothetical protein RLT58_15045 [Streptomyces sp. ITFR-16]